MRRIALCLFILASVAVRFWRIDAPFDDFWSWRQSDVAAIARNYYENGFHFTQPQIDWAGNEPGFVGTEFPLLPFTVALLYKFLGVHEWIGRSLTIVFFAASVPFVFLLARRVFDEFAGILALVFYAFAPMMIAASRAFMPDMSSLACALAGLYLFWRWLDTNQSSVSSYGLFLTACLLIALALLLKPTTATVAAPLAALAWRKFGRSLFLQPSLWLFAFLSLIPSALWYWHALAIAREFYPHHMFGAGGIRVMTLGWYSQILQLTFMTSLTPALFILAIIGLFRPARTWAFHWWLGAMILLIVLAGYGNRHEWYRLPLVTIAAALAGGAISSLGQGKTALVPLALILFLIPAAIQAHHYFAPTAEPLCLLARTLGERTSPGALIVVADDGNPVVFYYAHRKGWHFLERDGIYNGNPNDSGGLITDLKSLRVRGATHIAFYRATTWWLDYYPEFAEYLERTSTLVSASREMRIYELKKE
jgi:4-amino-4-deoxy-L-arabinose transferase-like glycosyltransferase